MLRLLGTSGRGAVREQKAFKSRQASLLDFWNTIKIYQQSEASRLEMVL